MQPSALVLKSLRELLAHCEHAQCGETLPFETKIAAHCRVSRTTVRRLLAYLESEKYIRRAGRSWRWTVAPPLIPGPDNDAPADGREESARRYLIRLLATGELTPGAKLSEVSVARNLGMSTVPVREALRSIENFGLIVRHARRSWTTVKLDTAQVRELMEMRRLVELHCLGRLRKGSVTEGQFVRIAKDTRRILDKKQFDLAEGLRIDRLFHETLVASVGNRFLRRQSRFIYWLIEFEFAHARMPTAKLIDGLADHLRILDFIANADYNRAYRELKGHLQKAESILLSFQSKEQKKDPSEVDLQAFE